MKGKHSFHPRPGKPKVSHPIKPEQRLNSSHKRRTASDFRMGSLTQERPFQNKNCDFGRFKSDIKRLLRISLPQEGRTALRQATREVGDLQHWGFPVLDWANPEPPLITARTGAGGP